MDTCQIVLCPCPTRDEALQISTDLVESGLAAAVNMIESDSVHRWRGEVRRRTESLLMIKSRERDYEAIERKIVNMHSYDLPGIATIPITGGLEAYIDWLRCGGNE